MDLALIVMVVVGNLRLGRRRGREREESIGEEIITERKVLNMANSVQGLN